MPSIKDANEDSADLQRSPTSSTSNLPAEGDPIDLGHERSLNNSERDLLSSTSGTNPKSGKTYLNSSSDSKSSKTPLTWVDEIPVLDDSHMPDMTFRSLLTGFFVSCAAAIIEQFFLFKPSHSQIQPLSLQLASLIIGRCLHYIPGPRWWNPGPFTIKENVLSAIMATTAATGILSVEMPATQELYVKRPMHFAKSMAVMLSTQLIALGFAGMLRGPLVYARNVEFPAALPSVALFHSFHDRTERTKKQLKFFKKSFGIMALYEIIPQYIAPTIQAISPFCLAWQDSSAVTRQFGGSLSREGLGIFSIALEWNSVASLGPLFTPFSAQVNEWIGVLLGYMFYNIAYEKSWWNGGKEHNFPFLSSLLYFQNGTGINSHDYLHDDGSVNSENVRIIGVPHLPASFVLSSIATNLAVGAAITHCILWAWGAIARKTYFRKKMSEEEYDRHHIVCRKYPEVKIWFYLVILILALLIAYLVATLSDVGIPAQELTVALILAAILTVASAHLKGTTGAALEAQPAVQMLGGLMFPGDYFRNMWFTNFGSATVAQSVTILQDIKLGQYMHLSPIYVLIVQLIGTVIGVVLNYTVMSLVVDANRDILLTEFGTTVFTGVVLEDFHSLAIIQGIFAHDLFLAGRRYVMVSASLGFGFLLPIPFFAAHKMFPRLRMDLVNIPLICGALALVLNRANAGFTLSVIIGFLSQFYARRYRPRWFYKYNYVLSAAFDGGAQLTGVVLGFLVDGGTGWSRVRFPRYFLNPEVYPYKERAPDYCTLQK
ncbi:OPT oligopeptide transporter protein-domain-containing protein [Phakopsora pachyrhizi]|uniref:OPT oligopeptide transporter protein-domain-containing protein n=1 Tax=Phakopsora pachyrhizi TaxID=170000 RepID=A0AAV0BUD8_PHAPC|nr:OPT oligopeptide transporter protein-domain-containing protein [Phakopsora pachyrhizi]